MYRAENGTISHSPNKIKVLSDLFRRCGYCMNCRLYKSQSWAIRMTHESHFHAQNSFLTLTYNDSNLPQNGTLNYADPTKFIKKLRRRLDRTLYKGSLTYYRVGEYGENFSRPHYHLILFGYDFTESINYKGSLNTRTLSPSSTSDRKYYTSTFATDLWDKGFVDVGSVDYSTCMYTAKYVTKKLFGSQSSLYGNLLPEKASMSKSLPIGTSWIKQYWSDVYPHDYVSMNGKKLQPPRFYDEWLEKNQPTVFQLVKEKRALSNPNFSLDSLESIESLYATQFIGLQKQKQFLRDGCAPNTYADEEFLRLKLKQVNDLKGYFNET